MSAWIMTYNPSKWTGWDEFEQDARQTREGRPVSSNWSCYSSKAQPGDRFYLMLLGMGKYTRGIIASGVLTSAQRIYGSWTGEGVGKYVDVVFERILDYQNADKNIREPVLEQSVLKRLFPDQAWSPQSSGISVRPEYEDALARLWAEFLHTGGYAQEEIKAGFMDPAELLQAAVSAPSAPKKISSATTQYQRNVYVAQYAKVRANGICQLCGDPAPFRDCFDKPYLEAHHIIWLSRGGPDSINNVAALCPNCHRRMHVLDDAVDREKLMAAVGKKE